MHKANAGIFFQDFFSFHQAGNFFRRQIDLGDITGDDGLGAERVRNIFICSGVVFCASSRMMKESSSVRPRI